MEGIGEQVAKPAVSWFRYFIFINSYTINTLWMKLRMIFDVFEYGLGITSK